MGAELIQEKQFVSHYAIFDYWKDKCIDKYGNVYTQSDDNCGSEFVDIVYDWGEPDCWCCRTPIRVEDEENDYFQWLNEAGDDGIRKIWNCKTMRQCTEKAHIVPRMLGGVDAPKNMFILCKKCHRESPDTSNPKMFLSYIYNRRKNPYKETPVFQAVEILKNTYGITFPVFERDGRVSITKRGLHGGQTAFNTLVYTLVSDALMNRVALSEDYEKMFFQYLDNVVKEFETEYASHFSHNDIDKKALEIIRGIRNAYETFKKMEIQPIDFQ